MANVRTWFLRDLMEAIGRTAEGASDDRLQARVPQRLHHLIDRVQLAQQGPRAVLPLDSVEEVLLAADGALGDGSGRVLADAAGDLAARHLTRGSAFRAATDLAGTFDRIRMPLLELPFVDAAVDVSTKETDAGFEITISVPGRPRAARILRHMATGALWSCKSFCRDARELQVLGETLGDRVVLTARYPKHSDAPPAASEPPSMRRRPSRSMRAITGTNLQREVERILGESGSPPAARSAPPRRRSWTSVPAATDPDRKK